MGSAVSCTSFAIMERGRRSNRVRPLDDISSSSSLSSVGCDSFARVASLVPSSDEERWQFIDLTCQHEAKRIEQDHTRDWKTLRIFVSSTFSDFRAEREVLASQVFPELREWCESRRFHVVTTDLNWGLENETRTKERLEASLREIERFQARHFVDFCQDMSGWIPTSDELLPEVASRFGCIQGMSMQEIEIVSAVYRDRNPNAGFFFRDPGSLVGLPEDAKAKFLSPSQKHIQLLKHKIEERFPDQVKTYKCWVLKNAETFAEGQVVMQGLDCFARNVTQHFKDRILMQFPAHTSCCETRLPSKSTLSQLHQMNKLQQRVLKSKSLQHCFGQSHVERQIIGYINGRGAGTPLVLTGDAGEGKSTVLARCILQLSNQAVADNARPMHPAGLTFVGRQTWKLFHHFVGNIPGSRNLRKLLWRLWHFEPLVGTHNDPIPKDINVLARNINLLLSRGGSERVALFIDQLDMLEDGQHAHELKWLPAKLPDTVRVVISVQRKSACYKILHNRQPVPVEVFSNYQDKNGASDAIHAVLRRYDLWLNEEQLKNLSQKPGSANIMYLTEACHELLQYSKDEFDEVLMSLPVDLPSLIDKLLHDCETCHGGRLVIAALCLTACARNGLLETEMLDMLGSLAACSSPSGRSLSETDMQNIPHELVNTCGMALIPGGGLPFMMEPAAWERVSGWESSTDEMMSSRVSIVAEGVAPPVDHDGGDSGIGTNSASASRKVSGIGPEINFSSERRMSGSSVSSQGRLAAWTPLRRGSNGGGLCSGSSGSSLNQPAMRRSSLNGLSQLSIADHSSEGDISSIGSDCKISAKNRQRQRSMFSPHPSPTPRLLAAQWVHVYAGLSQLLGKSGLPEEGRLNFSHSAIREAVIARYFHHPQTPGFPFSFCTSSQFYGADEPATSYPAAMMRKTMTSNGSGCLSLHESNAPGPSRTEEQKRFALREMVHRRFAWWHARLANYFECSADLDRRAEELPYHLIRIGDWGKLARCLSEWQTFCRLSTDENVMDLLYYWRFAGGSKAAVVRYNEALETFAASPDVTDEEMTNRRRRVAQVLNMMGETEEAHKLMSEALEAEEQSPNSNPQRVADLAVEIAEILSSRLKNSEYEMGCLDVSSGDKQVIRYVQRSIELQRQFCACAENSQAAGDQPVKKRELAKALSLLSFHLMSQAVGTRNDPMAKEELLRQARKSIQECIGIYDSLHDNGRHIESLLSLGITYNDSPRQMLECYEEALRLCGRTYGHRHETAARIHLNLALLYDCQLEKPTIALSHYKKWLLVNEQVLGADHPKSIQARIAVVRHLKQMGKDREAERFRQKGVC